MTEFLRTVWEDIKARRNIDVYVTVGLAIVIAVLDVFNVVDQEIVSAAILATLALVSNSLLQDRRRSQLPIVIRADNDANVDHLCKYITANKIAGARLIQYSGDKVARVVELLLARGAKVEMLLHDPRELQQQPEIMMSRYQLNKVYHFKQRADHDFENRENLVIRYYREPASIRAVKLDDSFLSMGWYTYRDRDNASDTPWLYGHNNATINIRLDSSEARDLVATFDKVFETLWDSSISHEDIKAQIDQLDPSWVG
jgi:hypothetical protein